jgi:hypothetical protein
MTSTPIFLLNTSLPRNWKRRVAALPVAPEKKEKTPIVPVPADAPPCNFMLPDIGKPSVLYPYHNADGALLCYIARFETTHPDTGYVRKRFFQCVIVNCPTASAAGAVLGCRSLDHSITCPK